MKRLLGGALLLLAATGCDRWVQPSAPAACYAPWEEGLTLGFVNPAQPGQPRRQWRVAEVKEDAEGRHVRVEVTDLQGVETYQFLHQPDGCVALTNDAGARATVLPAGFPDRVATWKDALDNDYRVIGLAKPNLPGLRLPDPNALGVWVEYHTGGMRHRKLLVPDLGEVENVVWRDGAWVTVERLVTLGFTDSPNPGSAR